MEKKTTNRKTCRNPKEANKPEDAHDQEAPFKDDVDICQQLMSRYSASAAPHHRHLLATAAAIRSILVSQSVPLEPSSYFAAAIENLSGPGAADSDAVGALLSLVSILAPMVSEHGIAEEKAREAVGVLVGVVGGKREGVKLGVGSVRGLVKCLGSLVLGFCDSGNWESIREGFEALVKFSLDKRPKVRRSGQECVEKVFKSFGSSSVRMEASKLVLSLVESCKLEAIKLSELSVEDGSKEVSLSQPEHLEVLYILHLVKIVVPCLTAEISLKVLPQLVGLMHSKFSVLTRHLFKVIEAFLEASEDKVIGCHIEKIVSCLCSYVSAKEKNPVDTVVSALILLRLAFPKLPARGLTKIIAHVCSSVVGVLTYDGIASTASETMSELVKNFLDENIILNGASQSPSVSVESEEKELVRSICVVLEKSLSSCEEIPNKYLLKTISAMFQKLRGSADTYMRSISLKLGDLRKSANPDAPGTTDLDCCIGSAVVAMGPEWILSLFPISAHADDCSSTNFWLIPILKNYVVGAPLGYYIEHIVPLAKSLQRAGRKVKKSSVGEELQAHAHDLLQLLCSFCRFPNDTAKRFESLAELLINFLRKDLLSPQYVAIALQSLVKQNSQILESGEKAAELIGGSVKDSDFDVIEVPSYSKKIATRNIKALVSSSSKLLQALADFYVVSSPENRLYIKDAIECLASVTDSSVTKNILTSLCKRFKLVAGGFEAGKENDSDHNVDAECKSEKGKDSGDSVLNDKIQGCQTAEKVDDHRHLVVELASSLVKGANEDLVNLIYKIVASIFQADELTCESETYHCLSRILEEHPWFCSSRLVELIELIMGMKPPTEVASLRNRLACLRSLMFHLLKITLDDEDKKVFLILNEIIVTLKDKSDDVRKLSYDTLLTLRSHLKDKFLVDSDEPYCKLINMILAYLSSSSPHMKSGAVSALSVLVYNDADICLRIPEFIPSILLLLQSKSVEITKAVLGFMKVLVSCMQIKDLQNLLTDIAHQVLPWSLVSRHHFRSKVIVIMEILIRKCGSAAVQSATPDRYKSFMKTVFQNRHHRSTTKEPGSAGEMTMADDSSNSRLENREPRSLPGASSATHHKKRKWEKDLNDNLSNSLEQQKSIADRGFAGGKRAKFIKDKRPRDMLKDGSLKKFSNQSGRKRKLGSGKTESGRPGFTTKMHKHGKIVKRQKSVD